MGKGKRNRQNRYRIVMHSAAYYKQKREFEARKKLKARQKEMREGNIFSGELIKGIISKEVADKIGLNRTHDNEITYEEKS